MAGGITVTFPGGKFQSKKLNALKRGLPRNLPNGLQAAARVFKSGARDDLHSGSAGAPFKSSHAKRRSRSGVLRSSVTTDPQKGARGSGKTQFVLVGPGGLAKEYAAVGEFRPEHITVTKKMRWFLGLSKGIWLKKTTKFLTIPKRAWFIPSVKRNAKKAMRTLENIIFKPVRAR